MMEDKKKLIIRLIGFIIAFGCAIFFITRGVYLMTDKKEGYYVVEAEADKDLPLYASGFTYTAYMEGSSNAIKIGLNKLSEQYSNYLKRAYILTQAHYSFSGYTNLSTLNSTRNTFIEVGPELYEVLSDAYAKTLEETGYNIFAGAYYDYWNNILILEDSEEFDPAVNETERERIDKLQMMTANLANFSLQFRESDYSVSFSVSEEYLELLKELELNGPILSLGIMEPAYRLQMVSKELVNVGFTNGYIDYSDILTVKLPDMDDSISYKLYRKSHGLVIEDEVYASEQGFAASAIRNFPLSENLECYYEVMSLYRGPFVSVTEESLNASPFAAYAICDNQDIVSVMYSNIQNVYTGGEAKVQMDYLELFIDR